LLFKNKYYTKNRYDPETGRLRELTKYSSVEDARREGKLSPYLAEIIAELSAKLRESGDLRKIIPYCMIAFDVVSKETPYTCQKDRENLLNKNEELCKELCRLQALLLTPPNKERDK